MRVNFITAISLFDLEDLVIEALSQKEFTLVGRAHSKEQLFDCVAKFPIEERLIVIYDSGFSFSPAEKRKMQTDQISSLELGNEVLSNASIATGLNSEVLLSQVYERLRKPEDIQVGDSGIVPRLIKPKFSETGNLWIGITGSNASPGITTVAINVAAEISLESFTVLLDGDSDRVDIGVKLGMKSEDRKSALNENLTLIDISKMDQQSIERLIPHKRPESETQIVGCVDLGDAPDLKIALRDRREKGKTYVDNLQMCSHIVYVLQPENHCLFEMERFYLQTRELYSDAKITFVLNKASNSSRHQAFKKSFRKKLQELEAGQKHFIVPYEYPLIDRAQGRFSTVAEVAPRSTLRKAFRELSIYLHKST